LPACWTSHPLRQFGSHAADNTRHKAIYFHSILHYHQQCITKIHLNLAVCIRRNANGAVPLRLALGLGLGLGIGLGSGFDYFRHCAICIAEYRKPLNFSPSQLGRYRRQLALSGGSYRRGEETKKVKQGNSQTVTDLFHTCDDTTHA